MDLSVFETNPASRSLGRQTPETRQFTVDIDLFSNALVAVTEIPEQDLVHAIDTLEGMDREDEIDADARDSDDDTAGTNDDETVGAAQDASGTSALNPLTTLLNAQAAGIPQMTADVKVAASSEAAATVVRDPKSGALAAKEAATLASHSGEARTLAKRAEVVQANETHARDVKAQLTGAAEQKATQTEPATKPLSAAKNMAAVTQETGNPGREISRLEQALRQAFPPAAPDSPGNPANQAAATATTTRPGADALMTARGADPITETSSQLSASGDRPSAMATAKAAANRPVFNLPNGRPAEQVSVQVQNGIRNGNDKIQIKLTPASLGNVEVKLELSPDKTVQAIVYADKAETLDMLERDARVLQKALEEAGLRTNSDSLSFAHRDSGGSADTQANGGDRSTGDQHADDPTGTAETDADSTLIETQARRTHDGLVDIEA